MSRRKDLDLFLQLRSPAAAIVALESSLANMLHAGKHEHIDPFLQIMSNFVQERHVDGLALISTLVTDMGNFVDLAKRIWSHFENSHAEKKWQLVLGIQLQAINQSIVDSLTGLCDFLIFVNHPITEPSSCKLSRPSNIPVTKHHRMIMQKVGESPSRKTLPCISVSLAVHDYRLRSSHERFMDDCIRAKWVNYDQTCPSKIGSVERDQEWGAAYLKKNTTMLVFEDEKTITDKVAAFLEECPLGCVAAFHVEYEDFMGRCIARERYSRLQSIAKTLQYTKVPSQENYVPSDENDLPVPENVCERGGSKEECHKRKLVCVLSMKAKHTVLVGEHCSHVVFVEATFSNQSRQFSVPEQSFKEFLSIEDSKHLVALSPSVTSKEAFESKQKKYILEAVRKLVFLHSKLDGVALFSTAQTQMELLVRFFTEVKEYLQKNNVAKILLAGLSYSHAAAYLSRLRGICEIIVFMTHHYTIPGHCQISPPNPYILTAEDILQMKKATEPAHGMSVTTCVSISLAVRSFKVAGKNEVSSACEQETWSNYAQVCPSKNTTFHNLGNVSVFWRNNTYMFTFENEGTLTEKVSHFLALHPEGCVLLFEADKMILMDNVLHGNLLHESRLSAGFFSTCQCRERKPTTILWWQLEDGHGAEPSGSEGPKERSARVPKHFTKSATKAVLICTFKADLAALKIAQEQCTHLVYMDVEYNIQGQLSVKNRTSFEDFLSSKLTMRQLLFVGLPPVVIDRLDTEDKINSFVTHGTTFLDDNALDGFMLFTSTSTEPAMLQQVAQATVKQFREHSRPPHLLMLAVHVGIAVDFERLRKISDILILLAHSYEPPKDCMVEYPSETLSTEKMFQLLEKLLARSKEKHTLAVCISINLAVRYFEIEPGHEVPGSKCKLEHWENYAQTCPNLKIHTERGSQNVAAYRRNGSSFLTFEDEETVSIKVLRYLHGNPAPCIVAFRMDSEDSCGACAAREKGSRLMAISRLLSPATECTSTTNGMHTVPPYVATRSDETAESEHLSRSPAGTSLTAALPSVATTSDKTAEGEDTSASPMAASPTAVHTTMVTRPSSASTGSTAITHEPSFRQRERALLCISATPASNRELLVRLCTHIVVIQPDKMLLKAARNLRDGGELGHSGNTELLLSRGVAHDISSYDSAFNNVVLMALITMNMDGYSLFVSSNTSADILLKTAMEMWKLFKKNKDQKEFTLVVGAQHATLNKVISELGKYSDYVVVLPDSLEKHSKCLMNSSLYFKYDDPMLLDELMRGSGATAMLAVSVFLPVISYDISKGHSDPGDSCIEEDWHGYAVTCFGYGFNKEERSVHGPVSLRNPTQLMVFEDEMTIAERITSISITNPNISVAAFYVDAEDLVGSCANREPASRLAYISRLITKKTANVPTSTRSPRVKRRTTGPPGSLMCVYSKEIRFPDLLTQVCDYVIYMNIALTEGTRELKVRLDLGYDQLVALDRDRVKGLLFAPEPHTIKTLMRFADSQLQDHLQLLRNKIKVAKISGLAFFFPDVPMAEAYGLYEKVWKFFSQADNHVMLLVGLTSVNDIQQLLKFAKKCDVLVLVKHHYSVPSKCVIADPFLKPIEEQDYENLAALTQESDFETAVGLSLPMAVTEYHLNSTAYTIGSSCAWERWLGYANTCPNPKMKTEYDDKHAKSIQRNGSMIYSFQDERVMVEQVLKFMKKLKQGCITAFYVEYEDWTGDCSARQPVTRLKMIASQLNRTAESTDSDRTAPVHMESTTASVHVGNTTTPVHMENTTPVHMEHTSTTVHGQHTIRKHPQSQEPNEKPEDRPMKRHTKGVFIICLFSRRLPNLPLVAQLCPYMAYMGLMHYTSNDRFYINDDAGLYQFLTLKQYNVQHLIIATAPMHSHLLTQLRETFLHDGVSRLMYSISRDQPLETLHGVMLLATSVVHLDSLYDVSLDIRNYLHTKMHLKLYLAVQSVGYNTSFDPLLKLKSSCDRLILYTNPYVPSPHCKIMPIVYQDLDMLDKTFFKNKKEGESVPCITLNLAVRKYELESGSSDFGQDCAKEHWTKFSATCPDEPGERGSTATSAYLKTSQSMLVFEDETSIEKKLSKLQQITPNMCVMATAIEREDWNHECSARPAASRMLAIAKYGGAEIVPHTSLTNGILICVVDRAPLIKMLPGGLCTHLVYSSVLYRLSSEHTFVAGDGAAFYAASNLAMNSGMHFLSEIDLISFFNINVHHAFTGFLVSSTKWLQETHQNGLAFMNIPNKTDNVKFESIIKKTWEHISTHKLQQMLLVGIDYRTTNVELVKSLSGKCTLMVFITHPRKSCCEEPCKVNYPSRPQTDEDSTVMQKIELGSGSATTPCISFNMAVRVFYDVKNTSCRREEWANYNQVCNEATVSDHGSYGSLSSDGNVFMFETTASIKDRISRVSTKVTMMCVAVFDLDLEDTNGSCTSGGVAFPRLRDIQQEITAVKNTTDASTNTGPPDSEKTWSESEAPEKSTSETSSESEAPEKATSGTWSVSETPEKSTSGSPHGHQTDKATTESPPEHQTGKDTTGTPWWQTSETPAGGSAKPTLWWEKSEEMTPTKRKKITHTEGMTESAETGETTGHTDTESSVETTTSLKPVMSSKQSPPEHQTGKDTTGTPWWRQTSETPAGGSTKPTPWLEKSEEMTPIESEETTHADGMTESAETGETTGHTAESEEMTPTESEEITHPEGMTAETGETAGHTEIGELTHTNEITDAGSSMETTSGKPVPSSRRVLLCITASTNIGNLLQLDLCTGLIYSAVNYDVEMQKFDLKNDDINELQKLRKGSVPFMATEVDTRGIVTSKVRHIVTDFFAKTEEFLATNNLDGIAFLAAHQDAVEVEPFATEFWNRSMKFKRQPLVIIILEFEKIRDSQVLAYALTGKCQYLILRKQDPKPHSSCAPRFPNRPLEKAEEIEMKYLEQRSRNRTSICLSFTLAVLNFHGVKKQGHGKVCEKELWVGYDKVCHLKKLHSATAYELKQKDNGTEIFSFEAERAMHEKVSKVSGLVQTVCAAAFDVEFEDVEGKCPALGGPFSRLHALKSVLQKGKYSAWLFCMLVLCLAADSVCAVDVPGSSGDERPSEKDGVAMQAVAGRAQVDRP
ncbi:uncharacterized protein LOC119462048 [Dermacentor silvarum]|uniref:uncharacterized protein LOC119462048 n=1 Tax=Dermacentor silvarum TaxID=543639 RepID=UPI00210090C6|nr:uncharacterized protein LOC119462048 [Dermacentor silvarum]